ncbi:MAG: phage protease [Kiritimatiellae bacterium]|nr:phage protease [Kiritimatiellia bacterium]
MKSKSQSQSITMVSVVTPVALAAGDGAKLPTRMKVLGWGDNPNCQGRKVVVGRKLVESMAAPTYAFKQIALDYEHNTCPLSSAYKHSQEPRPVAAFLSVDVVEGEGVFVDVDRWTPSGLENAHNYCDLSATPMMDAEGNVVAVVAVALTRTGAVPGITFSQAALAALAAMETNINPNEDTEEMNWKEIVAKQLGLEPGCTDDELQSAWKAHLEQVAAKPAAKPEAAALSAEDLGGIVATAVQASTAALSARLDAQEKQKLVDDARGEGKVVCLSAELMGRLTVEEVKAHCAALPVAVPLAALTPVQVAEGRVVALSATEMEVCASLGLTPEEYAKEKERK